MLTLDQLPFQAEGYRDLVCLITNYGGWHRCVIAMSQTCTSIHAWYYTTHDDDDRVLTGS